MDDVRLYHGSLTEDEIESLAVGLIARWNFDDNSNTAVAYDASGNGRNLGLASIGTSDWRNPATTKPGDTYSLRFPALGSGFNNLLDIPTGQTIDSIAFWIKPEGYTVNSSADPHVLMELGGDNGVKIVLGSWTTGISNEAISLVVGNSDTPPQITSFTSVSVSANTWRHVAVIWSESLGHYVLYVDGSLASSGTSYATPSHVPKISQSTIRIGRRNASPAFDVQSQLDDIRLYHGSLTIDELRDISRDRNTS